MNWKLAFSGRKLWVVILEKAWAKVHGSYQRIIGGRCFETFRDIFGAPSYAYKISDREGSLRKIKEAEAKKFMMVVGVSEDDEDRKQNLREIGLVSNHAYGLAGSYDIIDQ